MKTCIDCNLEKEYSEFYKRKDNKDGYRNNCKKCQNIKNIPGTKKYFEKESTILARKEYHKNYWNDNSEELNIKNKENYYKNKEAYLLQKKEYSKLNMNKICQKSRDKYNNDMLYRLKRLISSSIGSSFRKNGYSKKSKSLDILGCSFEEFKIYIESNFEDWMTWNNRALYNGELNYGWDIDHKIPLSSAETVEDIIRLNHFTNLQPLCSKINRDIKKDRLDYK